MARAVGPKCLRLGLARVAVWFALASGLAVGWAAGGAPQTALPGQGAVLWQQEVVLPDREDLGQYLGTLFEARASDGRLLAAAGFVGGSQTSAINDHRSLNFFVGVSAMAGRPALSMLPGRPYKAGSLFRLLTFQDRVLAYPLGFQGPLKIYSPGEGGWSDFNSPISKEAMQTRIVSLQPVENQLLAFFHRQVLFGAKPISIEGASSDVNELIESGLYANGRVLLSMTAGLEVNRPRALLVDCAWAPGNAELSRCKRLEFAEDRPEPARQHIVLGFHPLADQRVLLYGLNGFLYEYARDSLRPLVKIEIDRSWQIYSSIERYGQLLMGHYPSGNLVSLSMADHLVLKDGRIEWGAGQLKSAEMRPEIQLDASILRDEAQSVMTVGPLLAVGMWPWGEVFEGVPGGHWQLVSPTPVADLNQATRLHPFEAKVGNNCLGMRVFQIMLWGGGYVFQRTVKNEVESCVKSVSATSEGDLSPYGRVYFQDVPGLLTCSIPWTGKARRLLFTLHSDSKMQVSLDGKPLCSRNADAAAASKRLKSSGVNKWIRPAVGLYGRRTRLPGDAAR
jgi:hypothetical protein